MEVNIVSLSNGINTFTTTFGCKPKTNNEKCVSNLDIRKQVILEGKYCEINCIQGTGNSQKEVIFIFKPSHLSLLNFMCIGVLPACISVYNVCARYSGGAEEDIASLKTGIRD